MKSSTAANLAVLFIITMQIVFAVAQRSQAALDTPESVLKFLEKEISTQSDSISLVVGTANEDGSLEEDFSYNADAALPLASTIKIVVLAAYAQEVAEGNLDPQTPVSTAEWEAYYLPYTDGGMHPVALDMLGIETDELGFAQAEQDVTLNDIATAMIRESDNAATDYLVNLVGEEALQRVIDENNLEAQDLPISILGTYLAGQNHTEPTLEPYTYTEIRESAAEYQDLYLNDSAWREAEIEWLQTLTTFGSYAEQVEAGQGFARGSADDYAKIMAGVMTETFVSPEVSRVMRPILEWPMQIPGNGEAYETFGAKGGNLLGILTDTFYLRPKSGDYADENRIVILFLNELREQNYNDLIASGGAHQLAMLELATDSQTLEPLLEAQQMSE